VPNRNLVFDRDRRDQTIHGRSHRITPPPSGAINLGGSRKPALRQGIGEACKGIELVDEHARLATLRQTLKDFSAKLMVAEYVFWPSASVAFLSKSSSNTTFVRFMCIWYAQPLCGVARTVAASSSMTGMA